MAANIVEPKDMYSLEFILETEEKLELARRRKKEIELTNDKTRRMEWRNLNRWIEYAERVVSYKRYYDC